MNEHFNMHEDIRETRRHLIVAHQVSPDADGLGVGVAEALAQQHAKLHPERPYVVVGRQANISVHLANSHGVDPDQVPFEFRHLRHMTAHTYGEFRPNLDHVHERPEGRHG